MFQTATFWVGVFAVTALVGVFCSMGDSAGEAPQPAKKKKNKNKNKEPAQVEQTPKKAKGTPQDTKQVKAKAAPVVPESESSDEIEIIKPVKPSKASAVKRNEPVKKA